MSPFFTAFLYQGFPLVKQNIHLAKTTFLMMQNNHMMYKEVVKSRKPSPSHSLSSESGSGVIERDMTPARSCTPVPEPGDDEYWNDRSSEVNVSSATLPTEKYCFHCKKSYSQLGNRKKRLRHINRCKRRHCA